MHDFNEFNEIDRLCQVVVEKDVRIVELETQLRERDEVAIESGDTLKAASKDLVERGKLILELETKYTEALDLCESYLERLHMVEAEIATTCAQLEGTGQIMSDLKTEVLRLRQLYALHATTDAMTEDELAFWRSCMRKDDPYAQEAKHG